jgi:hypothetical protein
MLKNRVYIDEYSWKHKESEEVFRIVLPQIISHSLFNHVQKMIEIAESDEASIDQRINCFKEIVKYTYPRLKLQELWVSPVENLKPTRIELVAGTGTNTNT